MATSRNHHRGPRTRSGAIVKWAVVALAVMSIGGAGWLAQKSAAGGSGTAPLDLFEARVASFDMIIPASGELQALQSIEVRNRLESRAVIKWIIDEGEFVKQGDTLVELVDDEIRTEIEENELRVESARSDFIASEKDLEIQTHANQSEEDKARLAVEIARLELDRWEQGEHVQKMKDLQLAIEKAERNLERFTREYNDSMELYKEGFESLSVVQEDEIRMIESKNELEKAKLGLETYTKFEEPKLRKQKTSDLEEAEAQLERVLQQNESRLTQKQADLLNRQRQLAIRENQLAELKQQLKQCVVVAPSDGLVVYGTSIDTGRWGRNENPLQIGQEVHSNQLLISLPNTREMVAVVKVHESQSGLINAGMPSRIRVDSIPDAVLPAKVLSVGVMAESSFFSQVREYSVKLLIDSENQWGLKPAMRCKADIILGSVEDALAVPVHAVHSREGKHFVWAPAADGKFNRRPVKVGRMSETMIEIVEGLAAGDRVLLREPKESEKA